MSMSAPAPAFDPASAGPASLYRARPLLGTLVSIHVREVAGAGPAPGAERLEQAVSEAFAVIRQIERLMSAHHPDSDLARLARAQPGVPLTLDPHTVAVLHQARLWWQRSRGAFDPVRAANRLSALGRRPAFDGAPLAPQATLHHLHVDSPACVTLASPLRLDLGGIAKGYAVDQAIAALQHHGIRSALVNAGGDMRAIGPLRWPVEIQHPALPSHSQRLQGLRSLCNAALATSVAAPLNADFIATLARQRHPPLRQRCTVLARDCLSADALTKWGLQARAPALSLKAALRQQAARLWSH